MTDVTTIKVQGQTVWFEALTDEQVDDALTHMPPHPTADIGLSR
jgi:autonomous glycyl radical cofactor GrcA